MRAGVRFKSFRQWVRRPLMLAMVSLGFPTWLTAQAPGASPSPQRPPAEFRGETTQDYNRRLEQLLRAANGMPENPAAQDYRLGADDLLEISVFEAPDLNRTVRIAAGGEISLPLLGDVRAAGLTPSGLERVLEELLRRSYMKEPHVGVFLREMQSHPVSVFGAVGRPGVYQIRGAKTLIEVLSMAQGLANDAGDTVIVMRPDPPTASNVPVLEANAPPSVESDPRAAAPAGTRAQSEGEDAAETTAIEVNLKDLLDSGSPRHNTLVHPGDVVKVTRAGIVYVVGEVRKPGGFLLSTNENISVLQALALAGGLTRTSAAQRVQIIRVDKATGARTEVPINLRRILAGKAPDPSLRAKDIVFVPNSSGRAALYRGAEAALGVGSSLLIYRTP